MFELTVKYDSTKYNYHLETANQKKHYRAAWNRIFESKLLVKHTFNNMLLSVNYITLLN